MKGIPFEKKTFLNTIFYLIAKICDFALNSARKLLHLEGI